MFRDLRPFQAIHGLMHNLKLERNGNYRDCRGYIGFLGIII